MLHNTAEIYEFIEVESMGLRDPAAGQPRLAGQISDTSSGARWNRRSLRAAGPDELWKTITDAWSPSVSTRVRDRPADFPKLSNIFVASGGPGHWDIEFADQQKGWNDINRIGDGLPGGLGFRDRTKLMIANSNNRAAASCIDD